MIDDLAPKSFFMAGFECSSHRRPDGVRLDLIASTGHDRLAAEDYRACAELGLLTARDGLRWHLIETAPGTYDWSSWLPMLEAAEAAGVQVMWDVFHYGSPDHLDQGGADFVQAFAAFAHEAALVHRRVTGRAGIFCPINEISYFTWAVRTGYFPPVGPDDAGWFKRHLVRAALAAVEAIRAVDPECRFVWAEPLIHVAAPGKADEEERGRAESARRSQFEAYDLLLGRIEPELGGRPDAADLIGVNFYPENQWFLGGSAIPLGHPDWRPLADLLVEVHERYGRPIFISETMAHGSARASWLHYVCSEARVAIERGVKLSGICLYPVTAYPQWDDSRHSEVGMFTSPHTRGRGVHQPLAEELKRQRALGRLG